LQSTSITPGLFVQIQFRSTTVYIWSGIGTVSWNSQTWQGLGSLLSLSPLENAPTIQARGISIKLSALDSSLLPPAISDFQAGLPVTVYFTVNSGGTWLTPPIIAWTGRTDQPTFDIGPEKTEINLACENRLLDMNIPSDRRHTTEDQQALYPGDLGLMFVDGIQDLTIFVSGQAQTTSSL